MKKIRIQLIALLVCVGALPVFISFFLVYSMINYQAEVSNQIGFDQVLEEYSQDLKKIAQYDLKNERVYRKKFENIQDLKIVVEASDGVLQRIKKSMFKFYSFLFGAFFLILFLIGSYISRLISARYKKAYLKLQEKDEKEKYLSQFEKISDITKKLNHEMKKPLGPIEIWNQNLKEAFRRNDKNKEKVLQQALQVISEEVATLKSFINSFNKFSSLPEPQLKICKVSEFFNWTISKYTEVYPDAHIKLNLSNVAEQSEFLIDEGLISQVFQNLIENALESNPKRQVEFELNAKIQDKEIKIDFINFGKHLCVTESLFENFVSSDLKKGRGLGLSIVKVNMIKHGGDIRAVDFSDGAFFKISLPIKEEK